MNEPKLSYTLVRFEKSTPSMNVRIGVPRASGSPPASKARPNVVVGAGGGARTVRLHENTAAPRMTIKTSTTAMGEPRAVNGLLPRLASGARCGPVYKYITRRIRRVLQTLGPRNTYTRASPSD